MLRERGYEPYDADGHVRMRNCPFHSVARQFPSLTCGMNVALLEGVLQGSGLSDQYRVRTDPQGDGCCATIGSISNES